MTTLVGTGVSIKPNVQGAVQEAIRAAQRPLGKLPASFGFVFAGPERDLTAALSAARELSGCANLVASSTAGEFSERGLMHGGVVVMLVASSETTCRCSLATGLKEDHREAALSLYKGLAEARHAASSKNHKNVTTVLLTDGLAGKGEDLVLELFERGQSTMQIVGGAAGDEGAFKETQVGCGTRAASNAAAAMHVFSSKPWGVGVGHGLRATTKPLRVTKANGNIVHEINNAPAFDVYKQHAAARGVQLNTSNAGSYMIANELGIHFFDKVSRARAPLSVGANGALTCAAAIPEGAMVSVLDGDPDSMVEAAASAAQEAQQHLQGARAAGVLLFDCVCRGMILKDGFQREIDAVRHVFGDVPVAGFLTYGEIARYRGRLDGWHNTTAVVAAIPA
jgi:methyl-accepting chemotaxis protein